MMEEVVIDSFIEDIPIAIDPNNFVASSFDEELSNLSVPSSDVGIEASDLGSLLEQFEEVSYCLDDFGDGLDCITDSVVPDLDKPEQNNNRNASTERKELTQDLVKRFKPSIKQKTAVMLPLAVPAKRGRGRAMTRGHPVALPDNCTPRRLQRVMMQHQELSDGLPPVAMETVKGSKVKKKVDATIVDENYFEVIVDHDYTRVGSASRQQQSEHCKEKEESQNLECEAGECDKTELKESKEINVEDRPELEEGEVIDDDDEKSKTVMNKSRSERHGKNCDNVDYAHDGQLFDKLPSYCTALSIPRKSTRKTASHVTGRGGITVHDYIERDSSPVRDACGYNKLPDYYSSFTNSTKYDNMSSGSRESKDSSGYSSISLSPSRHSRSSTPERSPSRSLSRSRSRHSHSRSSCRTGRRDSERRQSSYSPFSRYSSSRSCSRSSCSRSSSVSSSCSSSSSSGSSYCSTCDSRSSSGSRSPSPSPDRAWMRDNKFRGERSRQRRSRSRSRSYSRGRSYRPCPRETYRSRSRSYSRERLESMDKRAEEKERRREDKKQEREMEKKQQMKERRIVYVGGLPNKYTRHQLRSSFGRFGEIEHVQLHFREHGDNYGFVTFAYTCDAYAAIEKGNKVPGMEKLDLCFGGRRQFCDVEYADLDGNKEVEEEFDTKPKSEDFNFDELLRQARQKLKK